MKRFLIVIFIVVFSISFLSGNSFNFDSVKKRITKFKLENGLTFILLEDHSVPIVSFVTYANVGSSDERIGIYGISHFLEHLAFKGTTEVGTRNPAKERAVLDKMDRIFNEILIERSRINPDNEKIKKLKKDLDGVRNEASKFVVSNEFDTILKRNGGVGLNAGTSSDSTVYFYSLPSNKIELWAYLESGRFSYPVFREFYKEREVIKEERRLRTENSPIGKLIEELQAIAFKDHPYKVSVIGPMSNINHISRSDVKAYFRKHYTAKNLVIGVAGDVTPGNLKKLVKRYFTKIRSGEKNERVFTIEPKQPGEKRMTLHEDSQPWVLMAYHCPSELSPDFSKFEVLNYILTNGRSSRLNKKMVSKDKSAMAVGSFAGFPGSKYPSLYLIFALPNMKHSTAEMEKVISSEIEKLKTEKISDEELISAKNRIKVDSIKRMKSNQGLLNGLLRAEVVQGGWEKLFDSIVETDKVTADDIMNLAKTYFTDNNKVLIKIEKKKEVKK